MLDESNMVSTVRYWSSTKTGNKMTDINDCKVEGPCARELFVMRIL